VTSVSTSTPVYVEPEIVSVVWGSVASVAGVYIAGTLTVPTIDRLAAAEAADASAPAMPTAVTVQTSPNQVLRAIGVSFRVRVAQAHRCYLCVDAER